ncbi:MAG: 3-hydroxyacyl-CoA dehydrogenase NAD-binding domain-containing protein [Balneolaceae bacterium]|nr:3-hydroxyacyl-CoA dehydrogenase NAD-binding domain-containing protein [Balneolaceae bacterium]
MSYLDISYRDDVAVITLDQPGSRVNTLNEELISEFTGAMDELSRPSVKGVVLVSGKRDAFIAGADVEMLKNKEAPEDIEELSRRGNELLLQVEKLDKPVVAAIHGACLGGGLEVAMACHYRVASRHSKTVMGQPEVKLGLLPGGGGTQRLPRLVGLQNALTYMLTGKNIYPRQAYKMGLVDELTHRDAVLTAALAAVERMNAGKFSRKDKRGLLARLLEGNPLGRWIIFRQSRKRAAKESRGNYPAPARIIECVETGMRQGLEAGLEAESKAFGELAATPESKALVNLFFGMQGAKKNPQKELARPVRKLGVLGAGLMGSGIADVSANNGYRVLLKDRSAEEAAQGKRAVWKELDKKVSKRIISSFERDRVSGLITPSGSYKGFGNVDLVIEAVFEDLELKRNILREAEKVLPDHAIFASNTSSLPIADIAEASSRPEQVVGMHYFSPVPQMPLLEIITTDRTADWVAATARQVGIEQGKHVIVVHDGPGFYTTRILAPFMNEALTLLEEGISIQQLDRIMKDFGFPVGPAALFDEVGIDVAAHITDVLNPMFSARGAQPSDKAKKLHDEGYEGKKNGRGFYRYEQKNGERKKKSPNEEIYRHFGSSGRKEMESEAVQRRMSLVMVNEALHCLQEEILDRPEDGDMGAILGLGFPPFLGGPFRLIDREGPDTVLARLERLESRHGERFKPAGLLRDHASGDGKFYPGG